MTDLDILAASISLDLNAGHVFMVELEQSETLLEVTMKVGSCESEVIDLDDGALTSIPISELSLVIYLRPSEATCFRRLEINFHFTEEASYLIAENILIDVPTDGPPNTVSLL